MARPKKEVVAVEEQKKPKGKIKYFSRMLNQHFDYPAVDEDGKQKISMNNQGTPIYDAAGNTIPIHIHEAFRTISERAKEGYLSVFDYDPSDESAQNAALGEVLANLATQRNTPIITEDDYDRSTNPAMFMEKKRAREMEDELIRLRAENAQLKTPEELARRLDELTAGK